MVSLLLHPLPPPPCPPRPSCSRLDNLCGWPLLTSQGRSNFHQHQRRTRSPKPHCCMLLINGHVRRPVCAGSAVCRAPPVFFVFCFGVKRGPHSFSATAKPALLTRRKHGGRTCRPQRARVVASGDGGEQAGPCARERPSRHASEVSLAIWVLGFVTAPARRRGCTRRPHPCAVILPGAGGAWVYARVCVHARD